MGRDEPGTYAFVDLIDLASSLLGGRAVACSDDFFASMDNLVMPGRGVFDPAAYTDRGKLMDGWESRRRRTPGHDWCVVKLGVPGTVRGVDIDTNHFLGNHGPFASLEGAFLDGDPDADALENEVAWAPLLPQVPLQRGSQNLFAVHAPRRVTHVRLNMYPDGGIARLKVYGTPDAPAAEGRLDLAAAENGGRPVGCSDMFFSPMVNLIAPGRAPTMGDGWETRRRRDLPGSEWIAVKLGVPGVLDEVVLDTHHFKGNYPDRASLEGIWWPDAPDGAVPKAEGWVTILDRVKLQADHAHRFAAGGAGPFTHLRLVIHPCGGVSRMRVFGRPAAPAAGADPVLAAVSDPETAFEAFFRCCGSTRWARQMAARAPFSSRAELYGTAAWVWWHLGGRDWREAFTHHPRIGADPAKLREKFAATAAWSEAEQSGVADAGVDVIEALAEANRAYEAKFGYLFIVCATGKRADEMLALCRERLENTPENEIRIAAGEQAKITRLRLEKLA